MGWEDVLLPPLAKLISLYPYYTSEVIPPKIVFGPDRKKYRQLSPNHWEMGIATELLRSAVYGPENEWNKAREVYLHSLDLHLDKIGLWTSEQCTGAPHGGFYLDGLVAARMAVRLRTLYGRSDDRDALLFSRLDEYTFRVLQYMHATATENGEVICCGERMPNGPLAPQQSAFYRELFKLPHPNGKQMVKQASKDGDYFWLSWRGLKALLPIDPELKGIVERVKARGSENRTQMPKMAKRVVVERHLNGHSASYIDKSKIKKDTCPAVRIVERDIYWMNAQDKIIKEGL
jgi:hypothetical protein